MFKLDLAFTGHWFPRLDFITWLLANEGSAPGSGRDPWLIHSQSVVSSSVTFADSTELLYVLHWLALRCWMGSKLLCVDLCSPFSTCSESSKDCLMGWSLNTKHCVNKWSYWMFACFDQATVFKRPFTGVCTVPSSAGKWNVWWMNTHADGNMWPNLPKTQMDSVTLCWKWSGSR